MFRVVYISFLITSPVPFSPSGVSFSGGFVSLVCAFLRMATIPHSYAFPVYFYPKIYFCTLFHVILYFFYVMSTRLAGGAFSPLLSFVRVFL